MYFTHISVHFGHYPLSLSQSLQHILQSNRIAMVLYITDTLYMHVDVGKIDLISFWLFAMKQNLNSYIVFFNLNLTTHSLTVLSIPSPSLKLFIEWAWKNSCPYGNCCSSPFCPLGAKRTLWCYTIGQHIKMQINHWKMQHFKNC